MDLEQLWQSVLADIELEISRTNFLTWFKNSKLISKDKVGTAEVGLPNNFALSWVKSHYHKLILRKLRDLDSSIRRVSYVVDPSLQNFSSIAVRTRKKIDESNQPLIQLEVDSKTNLNPVYTFHSFIVGEFNELAFAAAEAVVRNVGKKYNPLFVYGEVGLGKTHLLQAIGNEIKKLYKNKLKVLYTTTESFTNSVVEAIRGRYMEEIRKKYRKVDVLIVDDIQFISGKEATQQEFFHTFNTLYENNKQIIISSDKSPANIPTLEKRLRSRFEGGMIADISYPDYESRLAILEAKAKENNYDIDRQILEVVASKVKNNIRELEGVLKKIALQQEYKKKKITLEGVEQIINEVTKKSFKNIGAEQIVQEVANFFNVSPQEMCKKTKKKEIVKPRQICMYLLREISNFSYSYIAEKVGRKDHTTVIHACQKISKEINRNPNLYQEVSAIKERIRNSMD